MSSDWVNRYKARKSGAAPQPYYPPPQPPQQYAPSPQQPQYVPQPMPGAPPHAPFGYDPATGTPIAPYGRDQYGNIITQPYIQPYAVSPQPVQQPAYDPRGMPMPQGYGQPPYGQVGQQQHLGPRPEDALYVGSDGQVHVDWSKGPVAYQGGKGNQESHACPNAGCDGYLIGTNGFGGGLLDGMPQTAGVFNANGQTVYPAPHCSKCGFIQKADGGYAPGGAVGAIAGAGVKPTGEPRMAPGAGNLVQVAGQHGLPNLFAPK